MKFVLDTNVLMSGIFFRGKPGQILDWWLEGNATLLVSDEILQEYESVFMRLSAKYPALEAKRLLNSVAVHASVIHAKQLPVQVTDDPDDEKFVACALQGRAHVIVSGDKHLLSVNGWEGIEILNPSTFHARFLTN